MTSISRSHRHAASIALMRHDLETRGYKLPPRTPGAFKMPHPTILVGSETWPTFVVLRGEDMLVGKLSITKLALAVDAETAIQVLDYVAAREDGLAAPDFAAEFTK